MASASTMARFESAEALLEAVRAARRAGYHCLDAYAPFPVPGLGEALPSRQWHLPRLALAAGVASALLFYGMQWYSAVVDYPFVVGGKPLNSWPAFLLVTFETGILGGVLAAFFMMLVANGLPRPYHRVFNWASFARASGDGFFLLIEEADSASVTAFLHAQHAAEITELEP